MPASDESGTRANDGTSQKRAPSSRSDGHRGSDRGEGRVAVVTGGGSGIGASIGRWLARQRVEVVLADVDERAVRETAAAIEAEARGGTRGVEVDVTDESAVEALFETVAAEYGRLDYLFANAGVGGPVEMSETTYEAWRSVVDVNLNGAFLTVEKAVPLLAEGEDPSHVVVTSSISGRKPKPVMIPYRVSKAAVLMLTHCLAPYLGPEVRVNALCPSSLDTAMMRENFERRGPDDTTFEEFLARKGERMPLGRTPEMDDLLGLLDYLLFQGGFLTGQEFYLDGGEYQVF